MKAQEYQQYLRSPHWKQFRKYVLRERGGACEECGISNVWSCIWYGSPLNVHHLTYDRVGKELPTDVQVLCRHCHEDRHGAVTTPDASSIFWKLRVLFKECPEKFWQMTQEIEMYPLLDSSQISLPFLVDSA